MSWKDLDIKLKAELIKLGVLSGIRDIKLVRLLYDDNNTPTLVVELSYNETNVRPLLGIERIIHDYNIPEEEVNKANDIIQLIENEISLEEINNQLPVLFRLFKNGGYKDNPPFILRILNNDRRSVKDWQNNNYQSTHKLSYALTPEGYIVYPEVQEVNGLLHDFTDPKYKHGRWDALDNAIKNNDTLRFSTELDALRYTQEYKQKYPEYFKLFNKGGYISNNPTLALVGKVNKFREGGYEDGDENTIYTAGYSEPITVTAKKELSKRLQMQADKEWREYLKQHPIQIGSEEYNRLPEKAKAQVYKNSVTDAINKAALPTAAAIIAPTALTAGAASLVGSGALTTAADAASKIGAKIAGTNLGKAANTFINNPYVNLGLTGLGAYYVPQHFENGINNINTGNYTGALGDFGMIGLETIGTLNTAKLLTNSVKGIVNPLFANPYSPNTLTRVIGTGTSGLDDAVNSGIIRGNPNGGINSAKKLNRQQKTLKAKGVPEKTIDNYLSNNLSEKDYEILKKYMPEWFSDTETVFQVNGLSFSLGRRGLPTKYEDYIKEFRSANPLFKNKTNFNPLTEQEVLLNWDGVPEPTFALSPDLSKKYGFETENVLNSNLFKGDYAILIKNAETHGTPLTLAGHLPEHWSLKYPMEYNHPDVTFYKRLGIPFINKNIYYKIDPLKYATIHLNKNGGFLFPNLAFSHKFEDGGYSNSGTTPTIEEKPKVIQKGTVGWNPFNVFNRNYRGAPIYESDNFGDSFRLARIDGAPVFIWDGKAYNTNLKPNPLVEAARAWDTKGDLRKIEFQKKIISDPEGTMEYFRKEFPKNKYTTMNDMWDEGIYNIENMYGDGALGMPNNVIVKGARYDLGNLLWDYLNTTNLTYNQKLALMANSYKESMGWTTTEQNNGPARGYYQMEKVLFEKYQNWLKQNKLEDNIINETKYIIDLFENHRDKLITPISANLNIEDVINNYKDAEEAHANNHRSAYMHRGYYTKDALRDWDNGDLDAAVKAMEALFEKAGKPRLEDRQKIAWLLSKMYK